MENLPFSASKPRASVYSSSSSSVEGPISDKQLRDRVESIIQSFSSLGSPSNASSATQTQLLVADADDKNSEVGSEGFLLVPMPFYPQSSFNEGGNQPGSYQNAANLLEEEGRNSKLHHGVVNQNPSFGYGIFSDSRSDDHLVIGYTILRLAVSQHGSQYLLNMLISSDQQIISKTVEGVLDFIFTLMTDQYGFRVFTKLIESCSNYHLEMIAVKITSQTQSLINASLARYGSKSVKVLIKVLGKKSALISKVTSALSRGFEILMLNRTGSHVVLMCLDVADTKQNELLYEEAIRNCLKLAVDEKGCISLNNFITASKGEYRNRLLDIIASNSAYLSKDPSGNCVVQHVLGLQCPHFTEKICIFLQGNYIQLSFLKGGSHVVEKCLNSRGMNYVIPDLLEDYKLWQLARNKFGNYVIQTALIATKRADSPFHQGLVMKLHVHKHKLQSGHGRNVLNLIENGVPVNSA